MKGLSAAVVLAEGSLLTFGFPGERVKLLHK